jgi:hypothetical protein
MTKDEVTLILGTLKTAYPKFYAEMSKQEMYSTIDLWSEMFAHERTDLVVAAVKNLINTFKWPPTIADIKEEMYKLTETNSETPTELWNMVKKAIRNSSYNSYEEFQKLPEVAKKFVGSPNQLREWAIGTDYNDSVVKGQFFKQIEIIQKREKDSKLMLPQVKNYIEQLTSNMDATKLLS